MKASQDEQAPTEAEIAAYLAQARAAVTMAELPPRRYAYGPRGEPDKRTQRTDQLRAKTPE